MAGTLVIDTLKSSTTGAPTFQNTSGTEIGQLCRAWVNFNGVTTTTIRASFNVSSVVRNGTGDYTVNFTNALADANYSFAASSSRSALSATNAGNAGIMTTAPTTSAIRIGTANGASSVEDGLYVSVAIFR